MARSIIFYRREEYSRRAIKVQLYAKSAKQIVASHNAFERNRNRLSELDRLFIKIYEDNANGKLSDERFDMLNRTFEAEQKELEVEAIRLEKEIKIQETQIKNIES